MKYLLDTHVLIWWFVNDPTLSNEARQIIANGTNLIYVSSASAWEIVIKKALGKLKAPNNFEHELLRHKFASLPISISHALMVENLPNYHQDPFDRILVSQATVEKMSLITRDEKVKRYDITVVAA